VTGRVLKAVAFSSIEFVFLLVLWMLFVSQLQGAELVIGLFAAGIGAVADGVVKAHRFAKFQPRAQWVWMFSWEPWYVLTGSAAILWALARQLVGKKSEAQFRVLGFRAGGNDSKSAARRALALTLTTIPPNFIVVGIDKEKNFMLIHQVSPTGTPLVTQRMGATQ
jgi:multisubunit Na+/H+ antiporter MnhE subunit